MIPALFLFCSSLDAQDAADDPAQAQDVPTQTQVDETVDAAVAATTEEAVVDGEDCRKRFQLRQ